MIDIDKDTLVELLRTSGFRSSSEPYRATGGIGNFWVFLDQVEKAVGLGGWRSIETAPRDGTKIDVWNGQERVADVAWRMHGCWNDEQLGPTWSFEEWHHDERHWHEVDPAPTHWMPLPSPP